MVSKDRYLHCLIAVNDHVCLKETNILQKYWDIYLLFALGSSLFKLSLGFTVNIHINHNVSLFDANEFWVILFVHIHSCHLSVRRFS